MSEMEHLESDTCDFGSDELPSMSACTVHVT